jgi:RNase adaptor protein for sRNA GlmZ degradation
MALNKKSKLELNTWFEAKEFHPYPSKNDVTILALKTNSSEKQVKKWIENKRTRLKINTINENESNITANDKTILRKYYETQTNHPGPEELLLLENAIRKDKPKIRQWFNMQRFKDKASKN